MDNRGLKLNKKDPSEELKKKLFNLEFSSNITDKSPEVSLQELKEKARKVRKILERNNVAIRSQNT